MRLSLVISLVLLSGSIAVAQQPSTTLSYDKMLSTYEYPFPVRRYAFVSQGRALETAYMYLPSRGDRPTVLLLHGKNFNGAYWEETAKSLHDRGYGVLIPDQIGFGKSSKPRDYQYSFAALAQNTKGLIESLRLKRVIVVGHSMGGMLAARFALLYPEMTTRLVMVNPIGLENYLQYVQYKDTDFFYRNGLNSSAESIRGYQQKNYYDGAWNDRYDALTHPLIGWAQGPDRDDMAYISARCYDMIFTQPVIEELKDLSVPVVLILGTRDRTAPGRNWMKKGVTYELGRYDRLGNAVKARNPAIEVVELDGLGHLPQIEDFKRFQEVFLNNLSPEQPASQYPANSGRVSDCPAAHR